MDVTNEVKHQRAMRELRGAFEAFVRTGVWGTCADCPFVDGKKIPELCDNSERYDHLLSSESLFEQYRTRMR